MCECGNPVNNNISTDGMLQKAGYAIPFQETEVLLWHGDPPSIYKDKTGQWQGTSSLSLNDLPKAILALQKAFEYLTAKRDPGQPEDSPASDLEQ